MEGTINALVDYTSTKCLPSKDHRQLGFVFISSKPVLSSEAAKKAWMLSVVGAYGLELNARPGQPVGNLYFTDADRAKKMQFQVLNGATAKRLQRQVKSGEITLSDMWRQLSTSSKSHAGKVE
jgi:hypothetical protein